MSGTPAEYDVDYLKASLGPGSFRQIQEQGISLRAIEQQLRRYRLGVRPSALVRACRLGDGILSFTKAEWEGWERRFARRAAQWRLTKFVPASGAASRMFQELSRFYSTSGELGSRSPEEESELRLFFSNLHRFAFYEDLNKFLHQQGQSLSALLQQQNYRPILKALLTEAGLDYPHLPKALLKFHRYPGRAHTALEEHLAEIADFNARYQGRCGLHLTVAPAMVTEVRAFLDLLLSDGKTWKGASVDISAQHPHTQVLAVNLENDPFLLPGNRLLFWQSGHGALLENLDAIEADVVWIKNIDNVLIAKHREAVVHYEAGLFGILSQIQEDFFSILGDLERKVNVMDRLRQACDLASRYFFEDWEGILKGWSEEERRCWVFQKLHRPLRVCGMVGNRGEVGGGPYWVSDASGGVSRQIVEAAQVDLEDAKQREIFKAATHFNPVNLVAGLRDYRGENFTLADFVDEEAAMISRKMKDGRVLKCLERPGLWNGGMALWNTVFVEIPRETFCPVKAVNDLLKDPHQFEP